MSPRSSWHVKLIPASYSILGGFVAIARFEPANVDSVRTILSEKNLTLAQEKCFSIFEVTSDLEF